jgi:hypothetical protein
MKKWIIRIILTLTGIFIAIQFVPVDRADPPVDPAKKLSPPPAVAAILRPACYDCHSNETRWPWYSYVAPVSWWIANHVEDGRRRLNLSDWTDVAQHQGRRPLTLGGFPATTAQVQTKLLGDMETAMLKGSMPLSSYLIIHKDARLTPEQVKVVTDWFHQEVARLNALPPGAK